MSRPDGRLIVITGGPGTGKTTLVEALGRHGFHPAPEICRAVMQAAAANDPRALPWNDLDLFAERVVEREIEAYAAHAARPGRSALDRAIPDIVGYLRLYDRPVPPRLGEAAGRLRYSKRVFLAPFWPAIYANDAERYETPNQARAVGDAVEQAYRDLGYEPIVLPRVPVGERARFVLANAT
ncbi:AAA family ATPase [Marinivivus vitaminiproducens]|uniref:AAA family ATPase n=1 Tax=Marinivivus vitaminiproducens TaxID=3035935 RepID=UPI0027AAAE98|nr:AAA family ATPase [Geminicoccaceae bacterium SCSIO 64248]